MRLEYQEDCRKGGITSLIVVPNQPIVAAGCTEGYIHLWRTDSKKKLRTLRIHSDAILDMTVSSCGRFLASIAKNKTVSISSIGGALYTPVSTALDVFPTSIAFSPHGTNIVVGDNEGNLNFLDSENAEETLKLLAHDSPILAVKYSPLQDVIFSCGKNGEIKIWDCSGEPSLKRTLVSGRETTSLAVSPDVKHLITGNRLGEIKVWNIPEDKSNIDSLQHAEAITSIAVHPNGRGFCSCAESGKLKLWDLIERQEISRYYSEAGTPRVVAFSLSDNHLYLGTDQGFLQIIALEEADLAPNLESRATIETTSLSREKSPDVEVFRGIGLENKQVVYKVKVRNQSGSVITNVSVTVTNYPQDVLRIDGPVTQTISNIGAADESFRTVSFRFDIIDERCVNETINSTVIYFDHHDAQHAEITRPIALTSICDLLVPSAIGREQAQETFRNFTKAESKITITGCPNREALHDITKVLKQKNFNIVDQNISSKSFTVTGMATGKYTKKGVGTIVRVPLDNLDNCETTLLVGAEDRAFIGPMMREIESIVSKTLNRSLEPLMKKLDDLVVNTNRILENAGLSVENQFAMRRMIRELSRKSDKTSEAAMEYLRRVNELSMAVSVGIENLDAKIEDFRDALENDTAEMHLEEEKRSSLSKVVGKLKDVMTSKGAETALLWAIKAGLTALGFSLPF